VLPGTYRAALSVDGKEVQTVNVAVQADSAITISDADRKTWFDTASDLHDMHARANQAAELAQNANAQLQQLQQQTRDQSLPAGVKQSLDAVAKEMEVVRRRLGLAGGGFGGNPENVRGRITQLKNQINGSTSVPTNTQLMQVREAKAALPIVIDQVNAVAAKMPGLVKEMLGAGAIFPALKPVAK
jgi:antitoxin component of MazEF toxin-antitoxin module